MAYNTDIERLNYYEGEILGATDFQAEQDYHRDMRRRHNAGQHTWGIVSGLNIVQVPNSLTSNSAQLPEVDVYIQPGMAVDGFGREIVALTKTQLTADLFAAYSFPGAPYTIMSVWISYAQVMLNPPADPCTAANAPNSFGRVQEAFALTVTPNGTSPSNDPIVVDGTTLPSPPPPGSLPPPPPQPLDIIVPNDDSIPFQEFAIEDSADFWYVQIGQVFWNSDDQVLVQPPKMSTDVGREYAGSVSAAIYVPGGALNVKDRFTASPLPSSSSGVAVTVEGSLTVDLLLNALGDALIGGSPVPGDTTPLSPLTIIASGTNEDLIQMRNPSKVETWYINEKFDGSTQGLNFGEVTSAGKTVDGRIFIQSTFTPPPTVPSTQNVGIGTTIPRNPLAVRAQGSWEELLSFEDPKGKTNWHLNQNPQGPGITRGLNFSETGVADFRLFLQAGGNVGIGTPTPLASLDVRGQAIFKGPLSINNTGFSGVGAPNDPRAAITFGATDTAAAFFFGAYDGTTPKASTILGLYSYQLNKWIQLWAPNGNVGIGATNPLVGLDVANGGLLHVAGNNTFPITVPASQGAYLGWNGLTGGTGETDFINNQGLGSGGFAFFNAPNSGTSATTLMVISGSGDVSTSGGLTVGSSLTVNGTRTYLIGQDGAKIHWIMGGGTVETVNNALAFSFDSGTNQGTISVASNWTFNGGAKIAYLADRFINRSAQKLERGDVVVLHAHAASPHYGPDERIPLPEVQRADKECDTCVCGIVDEPVANPSVIRDLDTAKLDGASVGTMVTVGSYAYCKADAASGTISPGDLLTTSSTPGYVQKAPAEETVPPGAIIGKALGPLKKGKGIIPILVSHQ